jgi:hypothetical protein
MLLCLLAALFAVEAKVAWFGPDGSPSVQISSAKLQPPDAPKVIVQIDAPSFPIAWLPQVAVILAFALFSRSATIQPWHLGSSAVPGSPRFFPSLFFRPPPSC